MQITSYYDTMMKNRKVFIMKDRLIKLKAKFLNFIKYNQQFSSFVVLSLMCTTLIRVFTLGNILEIQPFLIDFALILIMGSFGFFYRPQKQFRYFFVLMLVYVTIGITNTIYYTFFNSFASISLLTALGQVKDVGDAAIAEIRLGQFCYLIFPLVFWLIHRRLTNRDYFNFVAKFEKSRNLLVKVLVTGCIILGLCAATLSATAFGRLAKQWNREYIVNKFGMIVYQINDFVNTMRPTISSLFGYDVAVRNFADYFAQNPVKEIKNEYTNIYEGKNIIFIHMESISSFLIDLNINDQVITPNLNKLSSEGLYFTNFYPQIGVGTSSDTEFTINTSLMPSTNGTAFVSYFDRTYVTIPKLLKEKGYYTFSMHGNKASMWNRDVMHPNLGYTDFYSKTSFEVDEKIGLGISDKSFFRQLLPMLEEIENNSNKYMGTIITLSNHTPFEYNDVFTPLDLTYSAEGGGSAYNYLAGTKLGDYLISAHYADEALGEFIQMINDSEYFDDTIFVFYGDHDPRFGVKEYDTYYNFDKETGKTLSETDEDYEVYDYYTNELNRKTPLIIWSKNDKMKKQVDYYMGTIDVMPTIGNMFGFSNKYALGHDIFNIKNDNIIAFPNGNYLTSKVYYNSSKEEYKAVSLEETLSDEYLQTCKLYTETIIEVSNGIIIHDLIKKDLQGGLIK